MQAFQLNGRTFKKSSASPFQKALDPRCVAVSISSNDVLVTDSKDPSCVLRFSIEERECFIVS
jgi:hypothetical protein